MDVSDQQKWCNLCEKTRSLADFGSRIVKGKRYLRTSCRRCENRKRDERRKKQGATYAACQHRWRDKKRRMRAENIEPERWIWNDSRCSDRKKGRRNDLTKAFIIAFIINGCSYCGERLIRMTLDRIDNSKGHTRDNVIPACIRCNHTRGNMPYEAWLVVAQGMRKAREAGLFNGWEGRRRTAAATTNPPTPNMEERKMSPPS